MAQPQQEVHFAEVTPIQPTQRSNVAVTVRIAGTEADNHSGADATTVETALQVLHGPRRGAKHSNEFLPEYKGYLHTDGYARYHDIGEIITAVGCWVHARRKFDEAVKSLPKENVKGSSASRGLIYCNLLFGIEQEFADKVAEERYDERLKQAKPVLMLCLHGMDKFLYGRARSTFGKAFRYLKEQWPCLTNYLKGSRLEISNNQAERSIKSFGIDRKNFLFANTLKGATGSAIMFYLIQSAMENGLDPYKYLTCLLKQAMNADLNNLGAVKSCYLGIWRRDSNEKSEI